MKYSKIFSQAGGALMEFAFVIPVMTLLAVTGYNLMKDLELSILKRDVARSLSQSYLCSFKQNDPVTGVDAKKECYRQTINELTKYTANKDVLGSTNTDGVKNFQYSIHTWALKNPLGAQEKIYRSGKCLAVGIENIEITYVGGYTSDVFQNPHYNEDAVKTRALNSTLRLKHLFDGNNLDKQAQQIACENTQITLTELHFNSKPFFNFSRSDSLTRNYYEFSYQ